MNLHNAAPAPAFAMPDKAAAIGYGHHLRPAVSMIFVVGTGRSTEGDKITFLMDCGHVTWFGLSRFKPKQGDGGIVTRVYVGWGKRAIAVDFEYLNGGLLKDVPIRHYEP